MVLKYPLNCFLFFILEYQTKNIPEYKTGSQAEKGVHQKVDIGIVADVKDDKSTEYQTDHGARTIGFFGQHAQ